MPHGRRVKNPFSLEKKAAEAAEAAEIISRIESLFGLYINLFKPQWSFVLDASRRKTAICSRRAGKSHAAAVYLCETARRYDKSVCVYVALTRLSAKRILWAIIKELNEAHKLNAVFNNTELTISFSNGSQIWLTGAEDQAQIEKLRGNSYQLVIIDEAASFGDHLEELCDEVLEPALLETDGTLCMIGTPSSACVGKFHEATTAQQSPWSKHSWTILDNPHIPDAKRWLENRCAENGWDEGHPIYRREWLGQWVWDALGLCVRYTQKNVVETMPNLNYMHVLGVDLGYNDATAFQVVSSSIKAPECYIHDGYKRTGMDVTAVAEKIREYQRRYTISKIMMDTGGGGKMIAEELSARFSLPISAANKTDKIGTMELLNGDLYSNKTKILKGEPVLKEWDVLKWDESRKKEDPRFENHLCLAEDMMIDTIQGEVPIQDIKQGDSVLTRHGYKEVEAAWESSPDAETIEILLDTGRSIIGTLNHRLFKSDGELTRLDAIMYGDVLLGVSECQDGQTSKSRKYAMKGEFIEDGKTHGKGVIGNITSARGNISTEGYGQISTVRYPKIFTSIIRMAISITIRLKILWRSIADSTCLNTLKKCLKILSFPLVFSLGYLRLENPQRYGMHRKKGLNGTGSTQETASRKGKLLNSFVLSAGKNSYLGIKRLLSVLLHATPRKGDCQEKTTLQEVASGAVEISGQADLKSNKCALAPVVIGIRKSKRARVFNLSVKEYHEYFANGVLQKNSDASLYAWKEAIHWAHRPVSSIPIFGTKEYWDKEEQLYLEEENS